MQFTVDPLARQILVACAVSLPSGPTRLASMMEQLELIRQRPEAGEPCLGGPLLGGCRLLEGNPHVVYRIDADRLELLAMQLGYAARTVNAAAGVRRLAVVHGGRVLAARAVCSVLVTEHAEEARPAVERGRLVSRMREAVEARVLPMHERGDPTSLFRFSLARLNGLGLWLNELKLGIAIGAARADLMEELEGRGRQELDAVRLLLDRFAAESY